MLTVEEREVLRRAYHIEHKSVRQIAREFQVARQTVRKALASAAPATYTLQAPRPAPKLGPYQAQIAALLAENARLPRKQRYTSHKIFELLHAQGYTGSEARVRGYIAHLRRSTQRPAVYLPLEFDPGTDAQVDWGEAEAIIAGVQQTVQFFVMRLCYSRRVFAMAFPAQKQECFFAAHVAAFAHFGGVPHRLTYDNLTTAVKRVFTGRTRHEQHAFVAFRSHYLFDSHFCTPGQGHEKGGVEHGIGFVRRNFMVPLPIAESFADLNTQLLAACLRDDGRTVHGHAQCIADAWTEERPALRPLPAYPFDCGVNVPARLTPYSQVIFETNRYSVPVDRARRDVVLKAYPFHIEILDQQEVLAHHPRCYERNQDVFDPLHYLPLLAQRPGAFAHAKPIRRWREHWPPAYDRLLARLQDRWPDGWGVREFIRILELHQRYAADQIALAVEFALEYGACDAASVEQCLHQLQPPVVLPSVLDLTCQPHLADVGGQPINVACYNQLLERV
jgi:transposase